MRHAVDARGVGRQTDGEMPWWSPDEVEQTVAMVRLHLYNRCLPCGAAALRRYLDEQEGLRPLPSTRRISRILTRYGLTYGRTGWYDEETVEDLPAEVPRSAWVAPAQRRHYDCRSGISQA
jgi:hypothetical protein